MVYLFEDLYSLQIRNFWDDAFKICKANTEILFIFILTGPWIELYSSRFVGMFLSWGGACLLNPGFRWFSKIILFKLNLWKVRVLILGAGKTGILVAKEILYDPYFNYEICGFLDDDKSKADQKILDRFPILGQIKDLPKNAKELKIKAIIIAMPGLPQKKLVHFLDFAGKYVSDVQIIPDYFGIAGINADVIDLNGILCLAFRNNLLLSRNFLLKRLLDVSLVLLSLPVVLPIMGILALIIKVTSDGPVIFGHTRLGYNRKPFKCWKFRTMVKDAHKILQKWLAERPDVKEEFEKDFKLKDDPRITPIGKFLRKTSLDELPQLFNVLMGEMSLVGPRPIVRTEVKKYGEKARDLFQVKPGLTGLWQVSGRNDISYNERVMLDMFYIKNWSPWLDLTIIFRTIKALFWGKGVY